MWYRTAQTTWPILFERDKQRFDSAYQITKDFEGGLADDPHDKGGRTNMGVTQAVYDNYRDKMKQPRQDVAKITEKEARALYNLFYWQPIQAYEYPEKLSKFMFDTAVHHGVSRAGKILQRVLGVSEDGRIGPQTLQALRKALKQSGEDAIVQKALDRRRVILEQGSKRFRAGWLNRVDALQSALLPKKKKT